MIKLNFVVVKIVILGFGGLLLCYSGFANSEVLFGDDFEDDPADWECTDGSPVNWSSGYATCGVDGEFGPEWKMGPGRNGGNAIYAWKSSSVANGYRSEANKWLFGDDLKQEIYHRWYMKWDPVANKEAAEGFKFWRYITRENGYPSPPVIYLNARTSLGDTIANGNIVTYTPDTGYLTLAPMSGIVDNQWHSHEFRIKLNDNGSFNGELQYWIDGTLMSTHTGLSFGNVDNMRIHRFGVGIGNVSDSPWLNANWAAIAFDDVVVSTNFIGPSRRIAPLAPALYVE